MLLKLPRYHDITKACWQAEHPLCQGITATECDKGTLVLNRKSAHPGTPKHNRGILSYKKNQHQDSVETIPK